MGLVLERHPGQSVVVRTPEGTELLVIVTEVLGGKVKLCFQGDKSDFTVHRSEVQVRVDGRDRGRG